MSDIRLIITRGKPIKKEINVKLPTGRDWWLETTDFEIKSHIRKQRNSSSDLIYDLTEKLTVTKIDANKFRISMHLKGEDTLDINSNGFYDVIMSDVGTDDERLAILMSGPVKIKEIVTDPTGV